MIPVLLLAVSMVGVSLPYWLPRVVIALRNWAFARINGTEAIAVDVADFMDVYSHPAANGRSRGAALSDLFWYWLSPGAEVHQEHLEPGPRYDDVARTTRRILAMPSAAADLLAVESLKAALPPGTGLVRLRDLVMPVWAEFYHRLVFQQAAPDDVRSLIVGNADDVVTALKGCGLRHMDRRLRLTAFLTGTLENVRHELASTLDRQEKVYYLQGTFFNTAVVQSSEATAHILMAVAAGASTADLDELFLQTMRRYPLFGVAHRITTAEIALAGRAPIPAGSVLTFNYADFHRAGGDIPFGVAANRPCPAWHLAPVAVKAVVRELLARYTFATTAAHTRPLPNRGPCLMTPRGQAVPLRALILAYLRLRDRWEDLWRSLVQLVLGTYMVWHARRLQLCTRYFEGKFEGKGD